MKQIKLGTVLLPSGKKIALENADVGSSRAGHSLLGYHQHTYPPGLQSSLFQEPVPFGCTGRWFADRNVACFR